MSLKDDMIALDAHIQNGTATEHLRGTASMLSQADRDAADERWNEKREKVIANA